MTTFGTSAYLKLVFLNERPQRTALRKRLYPTDEGGYDFHRSMRLRAHGLVTGRRSSEDVFASVANIANEAERNSVRAGLERLLEWRAAHPGKIKHCSSALYASPRGYFKVLFRTDFLIEVDGRATAIHLWDTAQPSLIERLTRGVLGVFPKIYASMEGSIPNDLAVLSLQTGELCALSDVVADHELLGFQIAERLERVIDQVRAEDRSSTRPDDRPTPPPPSAR